ncbi:MAG: DUF819 family protein [Calditrichaeota bacterium]|nr:DUF819 family protein [Calditrichota bacterium]MCB9369954.1 DUF819 family protein [Calditrichota bacterium]
MTPLLSSPASVLAALAVIAGFFFWLEHKTKWKLFEFAPPLLFIYLLPVVLSNSGVIPTKSPVYSGLSDLALPMFLVLLLMNVDVAATVRVMGKGVFVMLAGTLGVVIGAPIGYALVASHLGPETWKGFGALAGSWIGGTGNMAAVSEGLGTSGTDFGLAVIADNGIYLVWLPILLASKNIADRFHKFTGVSADRVHEMKKAAEDLKTEKEPILMRHLLYLFALGFSVTALAGFIAPLLPELKPVLTESTYRILLITTMGLLLSQTNARKIPGSHELAMALIYLFVANMGAKASLEGLAGQAPWFLLGAAVWIVIHGAFLLLAARFFKVDVHTAAIASAANIGGAASAPVVAACHDERLVPVSVLMAMIGYAVGNYGAFAAAYLCSLVAP